MILGVAALSGSACAQTPVGSALNLAGYTPTLVVDASRPPQFGSGELPWWTVYQLAPVPFSLSGMVFSQGLPPNAAWAALLKSGIGTVSPGFASPFWSGYAGEAEAYPNEDMSLDLGAAAPVSVASGIIALTARPTTVAESATLPSELAGRGFVSGAFNTYPASQEYGYFEETARVPGLPGFWPAFWMVPENMNPSCAAGVSCDTEIDVMEVLGVAPRVLHATIHTSDVTSASYPSLGNALTTPAAESLAQGMHRYGVDWEPNFITFYFDGVAFYSVATPQDMHQPMYIISNLAIGTAGSWAGPTSGPRVTGVFGIEAIRAWASPATVPIQ